MVGFQIIPSQPKYLTSHLKYFDHPFHQNEQALMLLLMRILCLSLSQTQPQPGHFYYVCFIYYICFSYAVSLIKTIVNYCYWQSDWILLHS